jgi:hypothetical protein
MARIAILVVLIALCMAPTAAHAGANNADFHCTSIPGAPKITLDGNIPGDFASFELQLSNSAGTTTMSDRDERISVIQDFGKGVFTIAVTRADDRNLLLYALPATVKRSVGPNGETRAKFSAVILEAPKPGYSGPVNYESILRDVRLSCTYEYSI